MLIAGLGVWRMPDLLTRMHATTKAGVLGAGLMLVGVGIHFGEVSVLVRVVRSSASSCSPRPWPPT
jgi:multicomponent Na+:H+ antiporter subunit G